jgi:hypothetical protein
LLGVRPNRPSRVGPSVRCIGARTERAIAHGVFGRLSKVSSTIGLITCKC